MRKLKVESRKWKRGNHISFFSTTTYHLPPSVVRGYFTLLVLVFAAVFLTLLSALSGFIFVEKRVQVAKEQREQSLHIAEAGLEYYRWFLAHNPGNLTDGTGLPGPYVHPLNDPEGGPLGTFSLAIEGDSFCGQNTSVLIESTGWTAANPIYKRTLTARYTQPSVADYSTIVNSNVWAGSDRVISGPYHSNGGVRMDGTHNADVSSGLASWFCAATFGCSPSQDKPGVFGSGSNPTLWRYPTTPIDFNGISVNLASLQGFAASSGVYIPPSGQNGWHLTFNPGGTVSVRRVTGAIEIWGFTTENKWQQERTVMSSTQAATVYTIPQNCPIVFVEDDVWLDGVVSGKVTLAAADVDTANVDRSIILNGNITYANATGDGLTAIAEKNVLVGLQTPDIMTISGVFIAQLGRFGRNHYCQNDCSAKNGNQGLPATLDQYVTRSVLNTNGTVVSNGRIGTQWTSGGTFISGYLQRNDTYDRELAKNPPPFTPATSVDFRFVDWREKN